MSDDQWVWTDPNRLGGKPCIRGTRVPVQTIVDCLDHGWGVHRINEAFPWVPLEAIEHVKSTRRGSVVNSLETSDTSPE